MPLACASFQSLVSCLAVISTDSDTMRSLETLVVPVRSVVAHQMYEIPARTEVSIYLKLCVRYNIYILYCFAIAVCTLVTTLRTLIYCARNMHSIAQSLYDISTHIHRSRNVCHMQIIYYSNSAQYAIVIQCEFQIVRFYYNGGANYLFVYHSVRRLWHKRVYKRGINLHDHFVIQKIKIRFY